MPGQLEDLIVKHFRLSDEKARSGSNQRGRAITPADAKQLTAHLTPRQRSALDDSTLQVLDAMLKEVAKSPIWTANVGKLSSFKPLKRLRSPDRERAWTTLAVFCNVVHNDSRLSATGVANNWWHCLTVLNACGWLGKSGVKLNAEQLLITLESAREPDPLREEIRYRPALLKPVLDWLGDDQNAAEFDECHRGMLAELAEQLERDGYSGGSRRAAVRIAEILDGGARERDILWGGVPWAAQINESIRNMPAGRRQVWRDVLVHAGTVGGTKPGKPWFEEGRELVGKLSEDPATAVAPLLASWLEAFNRDDGAALLELNRTDRFLSEDYFENMGRFRANQAYLTGLAYLARLAPTQTLLSRLGDLIEHVATLKHDAREAAHPAAAAAVRVFDMLDSDAGLAALSRAEMRVRWPKLKKLITKSLDAAVARRGASRDDLEEAVVPDFGMKSDGLIMKVGDGEARLAFGKGDRPTVEWRVPDKAPAHIVPKSLKQAAPDAVERVKSVASEIEKMHAAQRTRLDLLFRKPRHWTLEQWKQRYLDHGLLHGMTSRLIWLFDDVPGIARAEGFEDVEGRPVKPSPDARVALWHPALRQMDEVVAWRNRLEQLGMSQPLKQAHREIYLITDAEQRTQTYSNRFAAHVVKNQTTLAITQVRKWKMGLYGGASSPSVVLAGFGLRAEWWVNPAGERTDRMGFPLYMATDQVRFYREGSDQPMNVEDVPVLAFSEVMRDVDLFVGIASVGNDANWQDGGPDGQYREYWHSYSFGDLSATAGTRREVLTRLVPRLAIANRCSINDKFLIVRGDVRTYKIHLGSGNILMEPNDQYLCIVPDARARAGDDSLFLPFEGDTTLSIIISKAFLLADDRNIKDATIARQLTKT